MLKPQRPQQVLVCNRFRITSSFTTKPSENLHLNNPSLHPHLQSQTHSNIHNFLPFHDTYDLHELVRAVILLHDEYHGINIAYIVQYPLQLYYMSALMLSG